MKPRTVLLIPALLLSLTLADRGFAQAVQDEQVSTTVTGEVVALDAVAQTVTIQGANGEAGVYSIDPKKTTVMDGSQNVGMKGLHVGQWIAIDANAHGTHMLATYIEVVDDTSPSAVDPALPTAAGATVTVGHNKLDPSVVQIAAGQSVTFTNVDEMPGGHTVVAVDGSFSSPALDKGASWSHSFDVPGVYAVQIKEHPAAQASIVVE